MFRGLLFQNCISNAKLSFIRYNLKPVILNQKLNNAELLFHNHIKGPEDLAVYKNELYTATHGGYVQKISNGKLVPVVKFGKDCRKYQH